MRARDTLRRRVARGVAAVGIASSLFVFAAGDTAKPAAPAKADLGGAERCLTYVSTDKPVYKAGEKLYVRGVMLDAATHKPLDFDKLSPGKAASQAVVEVRGPKGDVVASGYVSAEDSVFGFAWEVPAGQAGGEYTVKVTHPMTGYAPAERKFDVRAYRAPRLKSQIVFLREGYGPGDEAGATLHVERAEGGLPAGAKVTAVARVDGAEAYRGQAAVDALGNCAVRFKLPGTIERGEGTLSLTIEDGGVVETAAKTIPILLQTVDLGIYPEGGDLVAGLPARVYWEARTPAKKPADLAGAVIDSGGREVAPFRTEHEGRGRFDFTPKKGERYALKLTAPAGIKRTFDLPAVKEAGVTIRAAEDVIPKEAEVKLTVASTTGGPVKVTLSRREVELASVTKELKAGEPASVTLTPPATADGVLIATVWDAKTNQPLAERLVFRRPARAVDVKVTAEESSHYPGGRATVTVTTTDAETGKPVAATVGLTVTDDSVLEMIERREQAPRLPVMVFLENDVRELADAHVYLDPQDPKAELATDLLLGTQGWRRFAFVDPAKFLADHGDPARRALALRLPQVYLRAGEAARRFRFGGAVRAPAPPAAARGAVDALDRDGAAVPADGERAEDRNELEVLAAADPAALAARPVPAAEPAPAEVAPAQQGQAQAAGRDIADELATVPEDQRQLVQALKQVQAKEEAKLAFGEAAGGRGPPARQDFAAVRVYAHSLRPNRQPADRVDFTETLYWCAAMKTDAATGQATVSFALNDAVTSFRVSADAFDGGGAVGAGGAVVESVQPFYAEPKLPLEVTQGDTIKLPVGLVNGTGDDLGPASLSVTAAKGIEIGQTDPRRLGPKARDRQVVELKVGQVTGETDFVLLARAGAFSDSVARKLVVKPMGFPVEVAHGGVVGPGANVSYEVVIPDSLIPGSVRSKLVAYPTPLANLTEALERLIQEPSGCFEQTSSTCYPLVMAQQYFLTHQGIDPKLIEQSRKHLDSGYARLTGYECKQKGYEWFGGDPGHEALTAYGLLEFTDMAQVRPVDPEMMRRTREWLLARRDGKGGFLRSGGAADSFGRAPEETTNAYVTWALLESGERGLEKEVAYVKDLGARSNDSYVVALAANVAALAGDRDAAKMLSDKLVKRQAATGAVEGGATSITCSGGEALSLETTALALLAWMRDPAYVGAVERSMNWLAESCKAGRFGSTQSTILCLRAIVTYDKLRARPKAAGALQVYVDGHPMGSPVPFTPESQGAIQLPDVTEMMSPGRHRIELRMADGSPMPCSVTINYHETQPRSADDCKLRIETTLRDSAVEEGAVTEVQVKVVNRTADVLPTPVAIVGLPGGLEVRHDQLKELVKSGKVDAYEVKGREVVLYWRHLKAKQEAALPLSLIAAIPGSYTAPASRAYLYYTDELKHWSPGVKVTIAPKATN